MDKSEFIIAKMDCPSEENIIRIKLGGIPEIKSLRFDIPNRRLNVYHLGNLSIIHKNIDELNFNASLIKTEKVEVDDLTEASDNQFRLLWTVLIINLSFFIIEIVTGFFSRSMGLVADSLDMLADTFVYGLSLFAVGGLISKKKKIAKLSGYFQLVLAIFGFWEVVRRFLGYEEIPDFRTMIIVSVFALIANTSCLVLLQRSKSEEAHMKASMIFTSNDVIINIGVIIAGILVNILDSKYPDLIVGTLVFLLVIQGAFRILKLAK